MSPIEHAVDHAVYWVETAIKKARAGSPLDESEAYNKWVETDQNLQGLNATPEEIWAIATWVVSNFVSFDEED